MREERLSFEDAMALAEASFGLTLAEGQPLSLTAREREALEKAYSLSMLPGAQRILGEEEDALYGGYEPFSIALTHTLNNKAGLAYTSYAHTGLQLPVYVSGAGEENFRGSYDNTDLFFHLMKAMSLEADAGIPEAAAK